MGVTMDQERAAPLIELTARIVAAYVSNHSIATTDVAGLIGATHAALKQLTSNVPIADLRAPIPKVAPKKSVQPDYIICLEDGKRFKSLKRHLRTQYNLTPEQYRAKWDLPPDYPMVAANYARTRSDLAKKMGLGTRRGV
jgi:predicted transcriptional regulator